MSDIAHPATQTSSNSSYLTIKHAQALFSATPEALTPEQRQKVSQVVARQCEIERRILASRQASHVIVGEEAVSRGLAEISARFDSEAEFHADLARQGMDLEQLRAELERELRVEAVLETISSRVAPVSEQEIEIFYRLHAKRFFTPERRTLSHILLTFSDDKDRAGALERITRIHEVLSRSPERFAEQALRYSECPTAMQGGLLGQIQREQLYPELDAEAFKMRPASLSGILESPMGFHVLRCENIQPEGFVPLSVVRAKIREQMLQARRENRQRSWVRSLLTR